MKTHLVAVTLALVSFATGASAQSGGHVRVSVERAFGFAYNSITSSSVTTTGTVTVTRESSSTVTSLNLFGAGFSSVAPESGLVFGGQVPRFAIDYELSSHLTFGAAAFVSWNSIATAGGSELSGFGFGLAPRVGYTLGLTDRLSFWPRAGVTLAYMSASPDSSPGTVSVTSKVTYVPLWVNVEPMLVYTVDPHFSFTLGLVLDLPLLGAVTSTTRTTVGSLSTERTSESSVTQLIVAAQIGVMGRF